MFEAEVAKRDAFQLEVQWKLFRVVRKNAQESLIDPDFADGQVASGHFHRLARRLGPARDIDLKALDLDEVDGTSEQRQERSRGMKAIDAHEGEPVLFALAGEGQATPADREPGKQRQRDLLDSRRGVETRFEDANDLFLRAPRRPVGAQNADRQQECQSRGHQSAEQQPSSADHL